MRPAIPLVLFVVGCGGAPATPSSLRPSDVVEYASLPPGYTRGERLTESCRGTTGMRPIESESLLDVDCSAERVARVLRARAAEQGARVLVERNCRSGRGARYKVECSVVIAEPSSSIALGAGSAAESEPAPSPEHVRDLDEPRPQLSESIRVSFLPQAGARPLPLRAYDRVAETAQPAVARRGVGQVSATCADCEPGELRHALRVAAGRMGAGEVSAVRCFEDDGRRCVATALEPWTF